MRPEVDAWVGLGANLGDAPRQLAAAVRELAGLPGVRVKAVSPLYRSRPVDAPGPDYHNAVVALATTRVAPDLLAALQAIERAAGRERPYLHAPRTLDLDLLRYGDGRIDSPALVVPHPRLQQRAFVLRPLADLAPQLVPPAWLVAVEGQPLTEVDWPEGAMPPGGDF